MKKKSLSVVLIITLVMTFGMNAFAADPAVQASYDAFGKIKTAMEGKDLEGLRTATAEFEDYNNGLTEEQNEALGELIGEELFDVIITAAAIVGMADTRDEFLESKNASTAQLYTDNYKSLVLNEEWGADTAALIKDMITDGQAVYEEAQAYLPSENVMKVYEAYQNLQVVLTMQLYDDDFKSAYAEFEAQIDIYNELTEEELNQLVSLLEMEDSAEVYACIQSDSTTAKVISEMGELYDAYVNDSNETTAKAFIEYYDSIYNNSENVDEKLKMDIEGFFFDIHDVYNGAKALCNENETTEDNTEGLLADETEKPVGDEKKDDNNIVEEKDVSPKTGDAVSVMLPLTCMFVAAAVMIMKKKNSAIRLQ